jgi:lysophospholipase L1-like esterase
VDYFTALADTGGYLPAALGEDGVHPNRAGYDKMWPVLSRAIAALPKA